MATDPLADANDEMSEQAKWGLRRADRAVVKLTSFATTLAARVKALEDRVKALEGKP